MTFRDELIEAGAQRIYDVPVQTVDGPIHVGMDAARPMAEVALDAMLAHRTTDAESPRLAIVEPLGGLQEWAEPVFILAPDQPDQGDTP